jgi:hypothetical protein
LRDLQARIVNIPFAVQAGSVMPKEVPSTTKPVRHKAIGLEVPMHILVAIGVDSVNAFATTAPHCALGLPQASLFLLAW